MSYSWVLSSSLNIQTLPQTQTDFDMEYNMTANEGGYSTIIERFYMYDVMWSLAFALNQTMTMVESLDINGTGCESMNGSLVPLHQFDYTNAMMGCLIQWNLQQTNFSGVSVRKYRRNWLLSA